MESSESCFEKYFPNSSIGDFYSLDEYIDPSRVGDQELISKLDSICRWRKENDIDLLKRARFGLAEAFFLFMQPEAETEAAAAAAKKRLKTPQVNWGEWCQKYRSAIRNTSQGNSPNSPKFVGAKTTMEFKPTDGSKPVVGMTRYNLLTTREDGDGLDLDEDLALCHVFPLEGKGKGTRSWNGKRPRSGYTVDPREPITEQLDQMFADPTTYPILDADMDVKDLLLADQRSKRWQSFTKIHTKNPKLMYAACNHCNTMLTLTSQRGPASNCGTSSLSSHSNSKKCTQKQLHGNSSTIIEHGAVEI